MARNSNGFAARFPHAGLFFVIAVALAIPLTVWSLNNVSTQTQQSAASKALCSVGQIKKCQTANPGYCNYNNCLYYSSSCFAQTSNSCFYQSVQTCTDVGIPCTLPTPTTRPAPTSTPDCYPNTFGGCSTPTPTPVINCATLGGTCYNSVSCPLGTSIVQASTPLCGNNPGTINAGICCK